MLHTFVQLISKNRPGATNTWTVIDAQIPRQSITAPVRLLWYHKSAVVSNQKGRFTLWRHTQSVEIRTGSGPPADIPRKANR